jgi:hypothetical protein
MGKIAEYPELRKCSEGALWESSAVNKIGRLFQGLVGEDSNINTSCFFIPPSDVPSNIKPT